MSDGHCFISYSTIDGLDFARRLVNKLEGSGISVWFDKDDLKPSMDWDIQIDHALKTCRMVLFVMTADSTHEKSVCRQEWSRALSFKKPIVPLWVQQDIDVPFRLQDRQRIDFRKSFDTGLANLRDYLEWLDSPDGVLQGYKDRLLDAERDLQRAKDEDKPRIQLDIEELTKQIEVQEKIVADPQAAQKQTQVNIEAGLERERKPAKPSAAQISTKFINPPPGISPNYYQDRQIETKQVVDFLKDDSQRLMTVVGRGGVGKTAMVCRLLRGLEVGVLPDDLGEMKVDGIVYLSESGSHRVNFANIFYDLCKLLPREVGHELDVIYKNPLGSPESKMRALLEKFVNGHMVLLLDNFEPLVDTESFAINDVELDEGLRAFLNGTHTTVKIIVTTRTPPKPLNLVQPGRQRVLMLDEGLESPYAENILREMDSDGRLGLKTAPTDLLFRARERTRGYPRALEALFAILTADRYTTLAELLDQPTPKNVVEDLVGEAFNRLDTNAQKVMQALAVYNRPVTPAAVDYLLAPHLPAIDSTPILQRLANMHFARKESGKFYLHPVDREFAFGLIPIEELTTALKEQQIDTQETLENGLVVPPLQLRSLPISLETSSPWQGSRFKKYIKHDLTLRAADYFAQARKPRVEWKKLDDLSAQLAEFELRCEAGDYDAAGGVLTEIDFDYLLLWGHYRLIIELHEKLQGKIKDLTLARRSIGNSGLALDSIGKAKLAIANYEKALSMAKEAKNRQAEATWLTCLGAAHNDTLGDQHKAVEYYEQALTIAQDIHDDQTQGAILGNLGIVYAALGDARKAIEYYEQALVVVRKIDNKRNETNILNSLGNVFNTQGEIKKAIEYYKQALEISKEIGLRRNEGMALSNIASEYENLGETQKAYECYLEALQNAREIGNKYGEGKRLNGLAKVLIEKGDLPNAMSHSQESLRIGKEMNSPEVCIESGLLLASIYLYQNDLANAHATIKAALQYDVPENNHNAAALSGIITLRQGERQTAQEAFTKSIAQADELLAKTPDFYSALDAKGLALCGATIPADDGQLTVDDRIAEAVEAFRKARKIAPHAGVIKHVLRLFDELVKCDKEGILKDVRKAVEGKE
jgi:tetratricopeptide (TPR) repeat protein